jgi:hypothetical protein
MAVIPTSPTTRRRILYAAGAVLVAAAAAVTSVVLGGSPSDSAPHRLYVLPRMVVTDTPRPVTESSPVTESPTTPAPPPKPAVPHEYVARAVPAAFKLTGPGFTIRAHVCAMPPIFPLDPPGEQHHTVCWVTKGFGYKPGSHSRTSYVLGHSWAPDPLEVLNKVSERATRDVLHTKPRRLDGVPIYPAKSLLGSRITLRTPRGTLVYKVGNSFGVDKLRLGEIDRIMNTNIRNRLVLITCSELNGVDYHYNIVLDARLISSRRA